LTRENNPSLSGSEEASPMSRFAFGLPYFLFGLGSALNTGEHVIWSINLIQDCPNLCRAVCAILIIPDTQDPAEVVVN
jgi:hypothetical protein